MYWTVSVHNWIAWNESVPNWWRQPFPKLTKIRFLFCLAYPAAIEPTNLTNLNIGYASIEIETWKFSLRRLRFGLRSTHNRCSGPQTGALTLMRWFGSKLKCTGPTYTNGCDYPFLDNIAGITWRSTSERRTGSHYWTRPFSGSFSCVSAFASVC